MSGPPNQADLSTDTTVVEVQRDDDHRSHVPLAPRPLNSNTASTCPPVPTAASGTEIVEHTNTSTDAQRDDDHRSHVPLAPRPLNSNTASTCPPVPTAASETEIVEHAAALHISPGVDRRNADSPWQVPQYAAEIIAHFLAQEGSVDRNPDYLNNQPDVTERMRVILIDWLIDVHQKFNLHPETFFLAVNYVDRYLMVAQSARTTLQLVGVCAILMAAKIEEIYPPEVRECIYISANTYTRDDIITMERNMATALNFRLCVPTPFPFMTRMLAVSDATDDCRGVAAMALDISALDYGCLRFLPSQVGFAAVLIARCTLEKAQRAANHAPPMSCPLTESDAALVWTQVMEHYSRVSHHQLDAIVECANSILTTAVAVNSSQSRYHAVRRKFTSDRYNDVVSRYPLPARI